MGGRSPGIDFHHPDLRQPWPDNDQSLLEPEHFHIPAFAQRGPLWLLGGVAIFLVLVLYVPFLQGLFKFETLPANDLLLCFSAGLLSIAWFELVKYFRRIPA